MEFNVYIIYGLVVAAVFFGVVVVFDLIASAGFVDQSERYLNIQNLDDATDDPLLYFTTRENLARNQMVLSFVFFFVSICLFLILRLEQGWVGFVVSPLIALAVHPIPRVIVNQKVAKRNEEFQKRLIDITVGLSSGLRAGAGTLKQAIDPMIDDLGGAAGEEFRLLLREYGLGIPMTQCLERLGKRMPGEDLQLLIVAVKLTERSGGSLAEVLDKITNTIRSRSEFREKLATLTAEGRLQASGMAAAPLFAFGLLYLIDPDLMRPLVTTPFGWGAIGVVITLELCAYFWIRKIMTIEV